MIRQQPPPEQPCHLNARQPCSGSALEKANELIRVARPGLIETRDAAPTPFELVASGVDYDTDYDDLGSDVAPRRVGLD